MNRNRILFLSSGESTFVTKDKNILSENYDVTWLKLDRRNPADLLTLIKEINKYDLVFAWFISPLNSVATIIAKSLGKNVILIAGGYDVAKEPEINYGLTLDKKYMCLTKYSMQLADVILAVSENTRRESLRINNKINIETVHVGAIDTDRFKPNGPKQDNLVLTVGAIKEDNITRKGLGHFAKASKHSEDNEFVIVGGHEDPQAVKKLKSIGGNNLATPGFVPFDDLIKYYQKSKIYVQLSYHEGFGISLAEAMACNCVPVISINGALPEVVGNTGIYADDMEAKKVATKISQAKRLDGTNARKRVVENFNYTKRKRKLLSHVRDII